MSSYISKKQKVFRDGVGQAGDLGLCRQRSDGRMKNFASCTDTRAWCIQDEERRQYILDLIQGPTKKGLSLGKYIPIEVLIDLLLANKNADIARLQRKVDELQKLLDIYNKLDLTQEQKNQLNKMKEQMRISADELGNLTDASSDVTSQCVSDSKGTTIMESLDGSETADEYELDEEEEEPPRYCAAGGGGLVKKRKTPPGGKPEKAVSFGVDTTSKAHASETFDHDTEIDLPSTILAYDTENYSNIDRNNLHNTVIEKDEEIKELKAIASSAINKLEKLKVIMEEKEQLKKQLTHSQLKLASAQTDKALLAKAVASNKVPGLSELESEINRLKEAGNLTPEQETEMIKKELQLLKKYCDQLSNIHEENEHLKRQCAFLKQELKQHGSRAIEEEVETEMQCRSLEHQLNQSSNHIRYLEDKLSTARNEVLQSEEIVMMQQRSSMLEGVIEERDDLQRRLNKLQGIEEQLRRLRQRADEAELLEREKEYLLAEIAELQKYKRQSDYQMNDIQSLKADKENVNRSLEGIRTERDELQRKLADMENLQQENNQYHNVLAERDMLRMKLNDYEHVNEELERLRFKAKESDVLRLERDRLQVRIEELSALEVEVLTLVEQVKNVSIDRDMAKRQGCDMQCIIADQEDEIKALVFHVDRLSRNMDNQQDKIISALSGMRMELEQKNSKIATSEEQLAVMGNLKNDMIDMEEQLRCTIEELTTQLREKQNIINSLQSKLAMVKTESSLDLVSKMSGELKMAQQENEKLHNMINDLGKFCRDDHISHMLTASKEAVGAVIKEMHQYMDGADTSHVMGYMEEDLIAENKQLRRHSVEFQNVAKDRIDNLTHQLNRAIQENVELRAENELLQAMTEGIENDLKKINSQLEENLTSSDDLTELKQRLDATLHEKHDLESVIERLRQELAQGASHADGKEEEELQDRLEREKKLSKDLEQLLEAEIIRVNDLKQQLEALEQENNRLKSNMEARNEVLQKLSIEADLIPQTIEVLSSVSQQFREENEILKAENTRLVTEILRLENEMPGGEAELKAQIAMLQSEILNLKDPEHEFASLQVINKELETQIEHLKNEIDRLATFLPDNIIPNKDYFTPKRRPNDEIDDYTTEIARLSSIELDIDDEGILEAINKKLVAQIKELKWQVRLLQDTDQNKTSSLDYGPNIPGQLGQMKSIIDQQEAEIEDLKRKIKELTYSLENTGSEGHIGSLQKAIEKLKSDIEDLKCENKCLRTCLLSTSPTDENAAFSELNLMNENRNLREQLNETKEEMDSIRNCAAFGPAVSGGEEVQNAELEVKIAELVAKIRDLEEQLANEKQRRQEPKEQVAEIIPEVVIENLDTESDVQKLKDKIGELDKINKNLREKIVDLEGIIKNLEKTINEMSTEKPKPSNEDIINELKAKILELESGPDKHAEQTDDAPKIVEVVDENKIRDLQERIKELEEENANLKDRLASMKKEQGDLMDQLQQKIRRGSIQETEVEAELRRYRSKVAELEDKNDELQATIESLKSKMSDSTNNRIKELEAKIAELEGAKEHLENRLSNKSKEQNELADQLEHKIRRSSVQETELETEILKLKAKISELENINKHLEGQLDVERKNVANVSESERRKSSTLEDEGAMLKAQNNALQKENESLKKEVDELKRKLDTLARESVPELENDIATLRKQMESLKNADKENADLKKQIDSLSEANKEIDDLKKQLENLKEANKEIDDLKKQIGNLSEANKEIDDLKKQIGNLSEANKEIDDLKKQIGNLSEANKEIDDLKKQIQNLNEVNKDTDDLKKQADSLKDANKQIEDLKREVENLKEANIEIDDLKKQIDSLNEANKQIEDLKKQIENLKGVDSDNANLRKQIEDLKQNIDALNIELGQKGDTGLQDEMAKLKQENESLKEKLNALEKDTSLSQENEMLKQKINELSKNIEKQEQSQQENENLGKEIENLKQKIIDQTVQDKTEVTSDNKSSELENENKMLRAEVESLKEKINKLEREALIDRTEVIEVLDPTDIDELKTIITALEREIATLKNGNSTLEEQNGNLNSDNTSLKKEIDNLKQIISALEKVSDQEGTSELVNENVKLKQEIEELKQKIKESDSERAKTEPKGDKTPATVAPGNEAQRIAALETEVDALKKQKSTLEDDKLSLQKENDDLKKEIESLKQKVSDLEKELELCRKEKGQLDALQKENKTLKDDMDDLLNKLQMDTGENVLLEKEKQDKQKLNDLVKQLEQQIKDLEKNQSPDSSDQLRALQAENDRLKREKGVDPGASQSPDSSDELRALQAENDRLKREKGVDKGAIQAPDSADQLRALQAEIDRLKREKGVDQGASQAPDSGDQLRNLQAENERLKKEKEQEIKKLEEEFRKNLAKADSGDLLKDLQDEIDRLKKENAKLNEDLNKALSMADSGDILKSMKDENDRLKKEHEQDLKKLEEEYNKNLALAKEQYDTGVKFVRGRHSDSIVKLQDLHEESMGEVNREYEKEIDNLQKLLAEERKQCKEMLTSLENKLDMCRKELENERTGKEVQRRSNVEDDEDAYESVKSPTGSEQSSDDEVPSPSETPPEQTSPDGSPVYESNVCPCGARIQDQNAQPPSLKRATALVAKVHYDGSKAMTIALTKRTIVMTNIEPNPSHSNSDELNQFLTVEEERPVSLTQSVENILSKALKAGIENLNYDELSDLHKKTCKAANALGKPLEEIKSIEETPVRNRLDLMRRIANLETDLMKKQQYAHDKLQYLERSMKSEKYLLDETKNALIIERKRNVELAQRIGMQSKQVIDIEVERNLLKNKTSYHKDNQQKLIVAIEEERANSRSLEQELATTRNATVHLRNLVESEKERARTITERANETIEVMRQRLERSLDTEAQLRMQLGQVVSRQSPHGGRNAGPCPTRSPCPSGYSPDRRGRYERDMSPRNNQRR